jgi:hypothetical protein
VYVSVCKSKCMNNADERRDNPKSARESPKTRPKQSGNYLLPHTHRCRSIGSAFFGDQAHYLLCRLEPPTAVSKWCQTGKTRCSHSVASAYRSLLLSKSMLNSSVTPCDMKQASRQSFRKYLMSTREEGMTRQHNNCVTSVSQKCHNSVTTVK